MHQQISLFRRLGAALSGWLLVCLLLGAVPGNAQNLIPNGGFEAYRNCPRQSNQLEEALPWYNPTRATPDFYNLCNPAFRSALPAHTGQGMAGLFFDRDWAEYFAVKLTAPLKANSCYYFSMYITTDAPGKYIAGTIGAGFTPQPVESTNSLLLPVRPQILDRQTGRRPRLTWERIDGVFEAVGNEQYALIGSFNTLPAFLGFYDIFIDDVSLVPVKLDLGADTTLCGRQSTLKLDATTPGATEYRWDDGSTQPTRLVTRPGLYSVTAITSCKTFTDAIKVDYALDFDLGRDTTLCQGQTLTLTVPDAPGASFRWQDGSTQNTLTVRGPGQYRVVVKQATCTIADSILARFILPPTLELGPDRDLCGAETVTIEPVVTEGTFFWQDQFTDLRRLVSQSGVFRAGVRNDCATVLDSVRISYGACDCVLYAPTAFSPNNDGLNDVFLAYGCGDMTITSMVVFDRWGEVVFQTQAPPFQWNGFYRDKRCDPGVYAWRVDYLLKQGDSQIRNREQGSLILLR